MRELCTCGSGLPFSRCHGDARNAYAREQALREAEAIPALFPFVRVHGVDRFVERAAAAVREDDVPESLIDEGLSEVGRREWRRTVDHWAVPYADRWASLTGAAGETGAAERALVGGALRAAIQERLATPSELLEPLEHGGVEPPQYAALAVAVPPAFVWSIDEARAGQAAARGRHKTRQRVDAVEQVACALMSFDHVRRTRALADRLARELPFEGLPKASRVLANACDEVAADLGAARRTAAALLIAYVEQLTAAHAVSSG
jgi:hypothetical protein